MNTISACILLVALACANAMATADPEAQVPYEARPAPLVVNHAKPYSFAYEVVDPAGGNAYGHRENSDGAGIIELKRLLENYVGAQGLSAVEKLGGEALNVSFLKFLFIPFFLSKLC